jgi:hypothetical protein
MPIEQIDFQEFLAATSEVRQAEQRAFLNDLLKNLMDLVARMDACKTKADVHGPLKEATRLEARLEAAPSCGYGNYPIAVAAAQHRLLGILARQVKDALHTHRYSHVRAPGFMD